MCARPESILALRVRNRKGARVGAQKVAHHAEDGAGRVWMRPAMPAVAEREDGAVGASEERGRLDWAEVRLWGHVLPPQYDRRACIGGGAELRIGHAGRGEEPIDLE